MVHGVFSFISFPLSKVVMYIYMHGVLPLISFSLRVMAVPATVVYFTCYEQLKAAMHYSESSSSDWWKPMLSGAVARGLSFTVAVLCV